MDSSIDLSPLRPHGFPPPYHFLHHLAPPLPPLLDLAECSGSTARPLPRKPKHKPSSINGTFNSHGGHHPFHCSPCGLIPFPPSSAMPPKPKPRRKPDPTAAAKTSTILPCTECKKRFSSWEALFGLMRCDPERQWRGINPPPLLRRPPDEHFTDEEYEVASVLITLSCGLPRDRSRNNNNVSGIPAHGGWKRLPWWEQGREAMRCDDKCNAHGGHKKKKRYCQWERGEEGSSSNSYVLDLNLPPPPDPPPMENK